MPELPEVETIKLGLEKYLVGLKIKNIQVLNDKSFIGTPKLLRGKKILRIWRKAKILGIELGNYPEGPRDAKEVAALSALTSLIHLKMSGQLIYKGKEENIIGGHPNSEMLSQMPIKSTRVIFEFNNGSKLFFNDQRKFGWVKLLTDAQAISDKFALSLGPEPLDKIFTFQKFKKNLHKHKNMPIKAAIMDQQVVAGIGNIYASEACFIAGIDPRKKVIKLNDADIKRLMQGIKKALLLGIKYGGSTIAHFVNILGKKGRFLEKAYVYSRENLPCKRCGGEVKKIKLAGRGTYYCETCQK